MPEIKIEVLGETGMMLAEKFGFDPFECECVLVHESEVSKHYSGDNVHKPIELAGISEFHRFYLIVRPKAANAA